MALPEPVIEKAGGLRRAVVAWATAALSTGSSDAGTRWARAAWLRMLMVAACAMAATAATAADTSADLRTRFEALRQQGASTLFDRQLYLQSTETDGHAEGEVHALVGHPYALLRTNLLQADHWCAILILHLNVQYCRVGGSPEAPVLDVGVGRKFDQPLKALQWMKLGWQVAASSAERLNVVLQAAGGPFGTKDFRIELEAVPYDARHTLVHFAYGYGYGTLARWAMQAYLGTVGHDKVGFSVIARDSAGRPKLAQGMRGLLERNTVRYQLAIEAYLDTQGQNGAQQLRNRLQAWFDATERYPQQLHEVERAAYIETKLGEVERSASALPAP